MEEIVVLAKVPAGPPPPLQLQAVQGGDQYSGSISCNLILTNLEKCWGHMTTPPPWWCNFIVTVQVNFNSSCEFKVVLWNLPKLYLRILVFIVDYESVNHIYKTVEWQFPWSLKFSNTIFIINLIICGYLVKWSKTIFKVATIFIDHMY